MPSLTLRASSGTSKIRIEPGAARRCDLPRAFVVVDGNVRAIAKPWLKGPHFIVPPGERSKSVAMLLKLSAALLRAGHERRDPIVAIGGGVTCDLAAFAASVYKRGVPLHLIPTTLLAQVDAAIGGKNGVDLPEGKNLLGTIRQPERVLIDPLVLHSLPERDFRAGLAEIVKCAVIRDLYLMRMLEVGASRAATRDPELLASIIHRAIRVKVAVVEEDERENGVRAILNYGHTIGHGLEAASKYRMLHGEAISVGMEAAAFIGERLGLTDRALRRRQAAVLESFGLPLKAAKVSRAATLAAMGHDKKRRDGVHRFVIAERVGHARPGIAVPDALVRAALDAVI